MGNYSTNDTKYQLNEKLTARGVPNVADIAQLRYATHQGRPCIIAPMLESIGSDKIVDRVIFLDNAGKKRTWMQIGKSTTLYLMPGHTEKLRQAIADDDSIVFLAPGEYDFYSFIQADIHNVIGLNGESGFGLELIETCLQLDVKHIVYPIDNDDAGRKSAKRLLQLAHDKGFTITILDLSAYVPDKGDVNDLWLSCNCDRDTFIDRLNRCPKHAIDYTPPKPKAGYQYDDSECADKASLIEQVAKRLGVWDAPRNNDGWTIKPFSSPFREDKNPSAGFNFITGVFSDFNDRNRSIWELADHFGIPYKRQFTAHPKAKNLDAIPDDGTRRCLMCGQSIEDRHHSAKYCNDDCRNTYRAIKRAENNPLVIKHGLTPVDLANPTMTVDMERISELDTSLVLDYGFVGLQSYTGSGKTHFIKSLADDLERQINQQSREARIAVFVNNRALAKDLCNRLGFMNYQDVKGSLYDIKRLVVCLNSVTRLQNDIGEYPIYDLTIFEEANHLLNHLQSDTFKRENKAVNAYTVLRHTIRTTGRLLALDAHLSQTVVDTIQKLRTTKERRNPMPMTVIRNTYREERGTARLYSDEGEAIDNSTQDAGDIHKLFAPCETVKQSEKLHTHLCELYGSNNVLLVNKNTSSNPDVVEFLSNPDEGFKRYRAIVSTSTISSGFDIQTPAVVCGLFNGAVPLTASDIVQMIARVRNPIGLHIYVKPVDHKQQTTDATEIYKQQKAKAVRNHTLIEIDDDGKTYISKQHEQLLYVTSRLQASHNKQLNDLLSYVIAYLEFDGFDTSILWGKNEAVNEQLANHAEKLTEDMQALRLDPDTIPIDSDEMDALRDDPTYTITDRDIAGYDKWKVLNSVGNRPYTEQLDNDLLHPRNRQKLYALTDLYINDKYLMQFDIKDDRLLHKRHYRTLNKRVNEAAIKALFDVDRLEDARNLSISASELESRLNRYLETYGDDLKAVGLNPDDYTTSSRLINAILDRFGMKKTSKQVSTGGRGENKRERYYHIETDKLNRWLSYKDSRMKMIADRERQQYGIAV